MNLDTGQLREENAAQRLALHRFQATIRINLPLSDNWRILGFEWPYEYPRPHPGQFFTFRPRALDGIDAGLLRRPLAFAGLSDSLALSIYEVKGPGTRALGHAKPDDSIDIIAPLGNGFPLPEAGESPVLLGGGIGIGPMLYLQSILESSRLFLGFRSADAIPDFRKSPVLRGISEVFKTANIATDDGSRGFRGTVLDAAALQIGYSELGCGHTHLYACGPGPMLSAVDHFSTGSACAAHISVEQWMACGVGACHGCVLPSNAGGYVRACADGPVFASGILRWEGGKHG